MLYRTRAVALFLLALLVLIPVIIGAMLTNDVAEDRPVPLENRPH